MLSKKMKDVFTFWDTLSLAERETFLSHACADLITALFDVQDEKGLEVFQKNLETLAEFAEDMQCELEMLKRRNAISQNLNSIQEDVKRSGFNQAIAERLAQLSENVNDYVAEYASPEECDKADEDAYNNIKALIAQETADAEVVPEIPELFSEELPDTLREALSA